MTSTPSIVFDQQTLDKLRPILKDMITRCIEIADEMIVPITDGMLGDVLDNGTINHLRAESMKVVLDRLIVNGQGNLPVFARLPQGVAMINELLAENGSTVRMSVTYS